jgi:hypothetical protein
MDSRTQAIGKKVKIRLEGLLLYRHWKPLTLSSSTESLYEYRRERIF